MQVKKANTRKIILKVAREEFILHGFKDASMRTIAARAEVSLSNIYNYFSNKNNIFIEVLSPLFMSINQRFIENERKGNDFVTANVSTIRFYQEKTVSDFLSIIKNYKPELHLLLFKSSGSSVENYRDTFADQQTETGLAYFKEIKEKYPKKNINISTFFIHITSSLWLTILGEIITHDELSEKDIKKFLSDYVTYSTAGWQKLMNLEYL